MTARLKPSLTESLDRWLHARGIRQGAPRSGDDEITAAAAELNEAIDRSIRRALRSIETPEL